MSISSFGLTLRTARSLIAFQRLYFVPIYAAALNRRAFIGKASLQSLESFLRLPLCAVSMQTVDCARMRGELNFKRHARSHAFTSHNVDNCGRRVRHAERLP